MVSLAEFAPDQGIRGGIIDLSGDPKPMFQHVYRIVHLAELEQSEPRSAIGFDSIRGRRLGTQRSHDPAQLLELFLDVLRSGVRFGAQRHVLDRGSQRVFVFVEQLQGITGGTSPQHGRHEGKHDPRLEIRCTGELLNAPGCLIESSLSEE